MSNSRGKSQGNGIPDSLAQLLAAADKRNSFPAGTMASVMQQEVGGQFDKYLQDPAAYHYEAGPDGRRVAKHTGKVSTAFGPFGILESTARDPGYGVQPLQSKAIEEQIRFASDYLAARSKQGGLVQGLAGYGEGAKYAQQVAGRVGKGGSVGLAVQGSQAPQAPVTQVAAIPEQQVAAVDLPPQEVPAGQEAVPPGQPTPQPVSPVQNQVAQGPDPWTAFMETMQTKPAAQRPVQVADLSGYGDAPQMQFQMPAFNVPVHQNRAIDFRSFGAWGGRA